MVKSFKDSPACQKYTHKNKEKIIAYIGFMYDHKSELNKIQNLEERKTEACIKAKLNPNDTEIQNIINLKNDTVNDLIFTYLSHYQNSNRYHLLISSQQLFWNMQRILNKSLDEDLDDDLIEKRMKLRSSISKEADDLMSRIDHLYSEVYGSDDMVKMAENKVRKLITLEHRLKSKVAS